jgi:hypothetical protein
VNNFFERGVPYFGRLVVVPLKGREFEVLIFSSQRLDEAGVLSETH